jgi:hypothetical protein
MEITKLNADAKIKGRLTVEHRNAAGQVVNTFEVDNLVVTDGKQHIASRLGDASPPTAMSHMAIGSDSTTAAITQEALISELGRVGLTSTTVNVTANNSTVTYAATFPAGTGTGNVYEAGVFNASSSGVMLCRTTFPLVTKQSGDTIAITWVVTVS